ncbi:hypothetical protein AALB39_04500 [Lachnospiraceae bacterium 54-53]
MADNNAKCSICGKRYHLCLNCSNTKTFTPWRSITDTIECYKIFLIIRDYTNKYISKVEARSQLENYDLSELDSFEDNIRSVINEIFVEDKPNKKKASVKNDTDEKFDE